MKTTDKGCVNRNCQENLGQPEPPRPGNHSNQKLFILHCHCCGDNYGANGCDIHERKCPYCQRGRPGLELNDEERSLRP